MLFYLSYSLLLLSWFYCQSLKSFVLSTKCSPSELKRKFYIESAWFSPLHPAPKSWILNCLIIMLECQSNKIFPRFFLRKSYQEAAALSSCTAGICAQKSLCLLLTRSFSSFSFVISLNKNQLGGKGRGILGKFDWIEFLNHLLVFDANAEIKSM